METLTVQQGQYFKSLQNKDFTYQVTRVVGDQVTLKLRYQRISHEVEVHIKDLSKHFIWTH